MVDLSGGWLFAFATQACAWHGSLTPQSASVVHASVLFTGEASLQTRLGASPVLTAEAVAVAVAGGFPVAVGASVAAGALVVVSAAVVVSVVVPPSGGVGAGGGPHAAAAKAGAPKRSAAARDQFRLAEDMDRSLSRT